MKVEDFVTSREVCSFLFVLLAYSFRFHFLGDHRVIGGLISLDIMEDFDLQDYFMNLFSIIDCNILVKFNRDMMSHQ